MANGQMQLGHRLALTTSTNVASAGTITIGNGNYAVLTGTTTVNYITTTSWTAGSEIVLLLPATLVLAHNTGTVPASTAALYLAGAANKTGAAGGSLIRLIWDGTHWRQSAPMVDY